MGRVHIGVSEVPLSCDAALKFVEDPAHGAVNIFVGRTRDRNLGKVVQGVSYDVFDSLAVHTFRAICDEAMRRWDENLNIWLEHFKGRLDIGGISIVIAVSSPHREEAFQACRFIIESVKSRSPIWKLEHYADGDSDWTPGQSLRQPAPSVSDGNPSPA